MQLCTGRGCHKVQYREGNRWLICCPHSFFCLKRKTGGLRPARRHTFVRQQKYAKVPSLSRGLCTFARRIWLPAATEERAGPLHAGLPALLSTWGARTELMISSTRQVWRLNQIGYFDAVPSRVPLPEANGLKTISGTNCLSAASFCSAGFHPFGSGNPATQGKASGAICLLTLFGQANKVRRRAGRNPPVLNLIL